jgi:hypothetical protein
MAITGRIALDLGRLIPFRLKGLNPVQLESRRFCDGRFAGWRC